MSLMFEAQLPELSTDEDLDYMKSKFHLDKTDELAAVEFRRLIHISLNACVQISVEILLASDSV